MRKVGFWLGLLVATLAGAAMGLTGVALGTAAGREVVVGAGITLVNRALNGVLTVDDVGGAVLRGLDLQGVRLEGMDGTPLLEVERLQLRYRVRDLFRGRIVLGQLTLIGPTVTIVEGPDGRLNMEDVLGLGLDTLPPTGTNPLLAFADVRMTRGTLLMRLRDGEGEVLPERRISLEEARLPYARILSPFPADSAIRLEITSLRGGLAEPALEVRQARGVVEIHVDSLVLDLAELRLPSSTARIRGYVVLDTDPRFDLDVTADAIAFGDLTALFPFLPGELSGRAQLSIFSRTPDVVEVRAREAVLNARDGSRVSGRLGLVSGPDDDYRMIDTDLAHTDFNVQHLISLLDTIPVEGRLSGRTWADGPNDSLSVRVDWRFRDTRVPGNPVTEVTADGAVALDAIEGLIFRRLAVRRARTALATVQDLIPAIELKGTLDGVGVLNGPWLEAEFSGTMRHVHDDHPESVARGVVRVDSRRDTVGIWASLSFDSLATDGLRPSYPELPLGGSYAGDIVLAGYLDALDTRVDISGPAGRLSGTGRLILLETAVGVEELDLEFRDLVLPAIEEYTPSSGVSGNIAGTIILGDDTWPDADMVLRLGSSRGGGLEIDSGYARVRVRDELVSADSLGLWAVGVRAAGRGTVGLAAGSRGLFEGRLEVDRLASIAPLLASWVWDNGELPDTVEGAVRADVRLEGSLDDLAVTVTAMAEDVRWDGLLVTRVRARATGSMGARGPLDAFLEVDSVAVGRFGFSAIEGWMSGRVDSLGWRVRARLGDDGAVLAGGRWISDEAGMRIPLDSAAVLLARNIWHLDQNAEVAFSDSAITITGMSWGTASGASRLSLDGRLPLLGPGNLSGSVHGFQVADIWALFQLDPDRVAGDLSGTFSLTGTARAPVMDLAISLRDAEFGEFRAPYLEGTLRYDQRRIDGEFGLWRAGTQIMNVELRLPVDLAFTGAGERLLAEPLTVRARADGVDLSFLDAMTHNIQRSGGQLWADFGIAGTWDNPQLTGSLSIRDGAASYPDIGVRHERVSGRLVLSGDSISIEQFSFGSGRGTAELSGVIRLEALARPLLDVRITAREFRALDVRGFLTVTMSGDVRLRGPVTGATLTGRGTVDDGVLHFADIIQKDIINLEDTLFADIVDREMIRRQRLQADFVTRFLDSLRIDNLALQMGGDVWLRSTEADIQLTGAVTVAKVAAQYRVDGILQTPRGTYRLPLGPTISREFIVQRGEVRYFGTPDLNAGLDIDARHQVRSIRGDPVTIFVHVGGTINVPTLRLSSDVRPPISDSEIISYLLFGAPSPQALGMQAGDRFVRESFSYLAGALSGQLGSALISDLGVPLDFIEIRPEFGLGGFAGTEIALGRRIGDRWFFTLSPRVCPQQQWTYRNLGASVEFRMSRYWRLSASADPLRGCATFGGAVGVSGSSGAEYQLGVDLLWERSY